MSNPNRLVKDIRFLMAHNPDYKPEKRPSKAYRIAMRPTKPIFRWVKAKKRRKIARQSRKINRGGK